MAEPYARTENRLGIRPFANRHDGLSLWLLAITPADARFAESLDDLSFDERNRADRFLRAEDRIRFALTRAALRNLLGELIGMPARAIEFAAGTHGKPKLAHRSAPCFNVSHSGSWALIAISKSREVGVDIELARDLVAPLDLARMFCSPSEYVELSRLEGEAQLRAFYDLWTCKEAVLKAVGIGIAEHLKSFSVELTPRGVKITPESSLVAPSLTGMIAECIEVPDGYAGALALA